MLQEASQKADSAEAEIPRLAAKVEQLASTLQAEEQVHQITDKTTVPGHTHELLPIVSLVKAYKP